VVNACNWDTEIWTPYTAIRLECFQIAQRMSGISFNHCPRDSNRVTHNLARYSFDTNQVIVWDGDPPDHVLQDVISDVTMI
jgi:hypothetical protein